MNLSLFLIAALVAPLAAGPSPSPTPSSPLKTIATVKTSPFCTSLGQHFNGAIRPMIENDMELDQVDTQLIDLKDAWKSPNYVHNFVTIRTKLIAYVGDLQKRLPPMQDEINRLRSGEKLTSEPAEAKRMHQLAEKMQLAYNKHMQLATDLQGVAQGMMDYDVTKGDHPLNGWTPEEAAMPADMKDIKSYLRFDGQRDVIARSESDAGDIAIDLAESHCK